MILEADQVAFNARALAQSDPFTLSARRLLERAIEEERQAQPGNFSVWATAALTKGYCVRRVEEEDTGVTLVASPDDVLPDLEQVESTATSIVTALRGGDDGALAPYLISDEERLFDVLDQIIGSEVRNRIDNASTTPSPRARAELEDYITYWVVRGYALRAAELATGAITKA